jgi:hypothetical protein
MSIPHNALPAAVKLRESALTAFKTYQDMKEGLNSAAAPTILGVAANYCVSREFFCYKLRILYFFEQRLILRT